MSFSQRFPLQRMAQRYAIYSDLWRKKKPHSREGYRRPQDALLSVQGVRVAPGSMHPASPCLRRGRRAVRASFLHGRVFGGKAEGEQSSALQRAGRCNKKWGEAVSGEPGFLQRLRQEQNLADPQKIRLRSGGVLG